MHVLVYATYVFDNCPWAFGVFGLVVPAGFQFGEVFLAVFGVASPVVGHQVFIDQFCSIIVLVRGNWSATVELEKLNRPL